VAGATRRAALAAAAALAVVTAARLPAAWASGNALNHVSGVWLGLADDLARGTLYRPVRAGDASGGTRYFPAVFAAEAALVRAGVPLVAAGQAVSLAAGLLLVAGVALLASAVGAARGEALAAGALALAGLAGQHALANARGDLWPAALSALALAYLARNAPCRDAPEHDVAAVARRPPRADAPGRTLAPVAPITRDGDGSALASATRTPPQRDAPGRTVASVAPIARHRDGPAHVGIPALLLVLAFAAKPTALSAAAAATAGLALLGARRSAGALAARVAASAAAVVVATDALSSGRFLDALRGSVAGGPSARTALAAPVRLAGELAREDPAGLVLLAAGAVALAAALPALARAVRGGPGDRRLLPALWLGAAWATALAIYAVPGTGVNHLVEAEAASAALVATTAAGATGRRAAAAWTACAAAAVAGVLGAVSVWRADLAGSRLAEVRAVIQTLPPGAIVSEDPLVPLLAGASPLVLDPFVVRGEDVDSSLATALRRGAFPAVVLLADLDAPAARDWYARGNLGPALAAAVRAGYRPAAVIGRYHLYLPRRGPSDGVVRRDDAR
jgi:hypothetical protein